MGTHILFFITKLSLSNLRNCGISLEPAEERVRIESVTKGTRPGGDGNFGIQDKTEQKITPVSKGEDNAAGGRQTENDYIFMFSFFTLRNLCDLLSK